MNLKRINIPPVYLFTSIALMGFFHFYYPIELIVGYPYRYVGLIIVFLGFGIISLESKFL